MLLAQSHEVKDDTKDQVDAQQETIVSPPRVEQRHSRRPGLRRFLSRRRHFCRRHRSRHRRRRFAVGRTSPTFLANFRRRPDPGVCAPDRPPRVRLPPLLAVRTHGAGLFHLDLVRQRRDDFFHLRVRRHLQLSKTTRLLGSLFLEASPSNTFIWITLNEVISFAGE